MRMGKYMEASIFEQGPTWASLIYFGVGVILGILIGLILAAIAHAPRCKALDDLMRDDDYTQRIG